MAKCLLVPDAAADIPHLAVAVRRFRVDATRIISHSAIYYRDADGRIHCLHLGAPNELRRDGVSPSFGWVIPDALKREELILLADLCELIFTRYQKSRDLPYGLEYTNDSRFDCDTGAALPGDMLRGFTCATFVLAIFNSYDIRLLDLDDWESRPTDIEWQWWIASVFSDPMIENEIPCLRFRPEEVAGACLEVVYPVAFLRAEYLGQLVLADLDEYLERSGLSV